MHKKGPELISSAPAPLFISVYGSDPLQESMPLRLLCLLDVIFDGNIALRFLVGRRLLSVCCAGDVFSVADGGAEQVAVDVLLVHFFPPDGISMHITKLKNLSTVSF